MQYQFSFKIFSQKRLCQIILSGPQPAGDQYDVGAGSGLVQRLPDSDEASSKACHMASHLSPMMTRLATQTPMLFKACPSQAPFVSITWPISNSSPIVRIVAVTRCIYDLLVGCNLLKNGF
jgi:hypothetical protein